METLIIIAGGLIGGGSSFKKNFLSLWIWYINTVFAMLPALSLASTVAIMLDLPFLPAGMRHCIAFLVLFIVFLIVLFKISEQILPKPDEIEKYPVAGGKIAGAFFGFLLGCLYAALGVYLAGSIPALNGVISGRDFKASGAKTLCKIVYRATFQTMPDEKTCLRSLNALAPDRKNNSGTQKAQEAAGNRKQKTSPQQKTTQDVPRTTGTSQSSNSSPSLQGSGKETSKPTKQTKKKKRKSKRKKRNLSEGSSRQQSHTMQSTAAGTFYGNDSAASGTVPKGK